MNAVTSRACSKSALSVSLSVTATVAVMLYMLVSAGSRSYVTSLVFHPHRSASETSRKRGHSSSSSSLIPGEAALRQHAHTHDLAHIHVYLFELFSA